MHIKRGTERSDGKVFWGYDYDSKDLKEVWITKIQFEKREMTRRSYLRKKIEDYKQKQLSLPKEERNYMGKYNPETGLYFIRVGSSGKEVWGTIEKLTHIRQLNKKARKKYHKKCYSIEKPNLVAGDPHPFEKGLFVVRTVGGKVFYGTKEQYLSKSERLRKTYKKYKLNHREEIERRKKQAKEKFVNFFRENPHLKRRRGDVDPVLNKVFWQYSVAGKEIWMSPEAFKEKRDKAISYRNSLRRKQKEEKNVGKSISSKNS